MGVGLMITALIVGALSAVGWVVAVADSAPNLSSLKARTPHTVSAIYAADGTLLGYIHADNVHVEVTDEQIPALLKDATVAIEDRRFWHHGALDYQGILRAGIKDVFSGGKSLQGASTLTMQLVDNLYLQPQLRAQRNIKYKIEQAKLAMQLEAHHPKQWILDQYLNVVPYGTVNGETALGVGAAAEIFFNRPVQKLDLAQMALLAGLPQLPTSYNPFFDPVQARQRRHEVLDAMLKSGYISYDQAVAADNAPLQVHSDPAYTGTPIEPYVFDYVKSQLVADLGAKAVAEGGLKVYTTINLHDQQLARDALFSHEHGGPGQINAALASVDPTNGHIVALAGTEQYNRTKFFYPVMAERQTGSAFKVFVLMTLIHDMQGDPNSTYYISRQLNPGWLPSQPTYSVHTAEETYQGKINLTRATVISDNTVFVQLDADLGPDKVAQTAHAMGITSHLDGFVAEAIGGLTRCCTMLEMADAYATLADGGVHHPPTIIDHVVFADGSVRNFGHPQGTRVFSDGEAYAATQVLEQVITSGTGYPNADYGCPAAGKTGTAENLDNAWFVGYTPRLATAVWVGYPQGNVPMGPNAFGGTLAAPIWAQFMKTAQHGFCGGFPPPANPFYGTPFTAGTYNADSPAMSQYLAPTVTSTGKKGKKGKGGTYKNGSLYNQGTQSGGAGVPGTTTTTGPATGPGTTTGGGGGGGGGGKKH
ncbi:MAG TPA: transglycosylase domain-containing protein [Solirubrobacteraceae bacterium]|nr:transglycosylase domain-containing protein [Solirubrobacteraceae bacterium]